MRPTEEQRSLEAEGHDALVEQGALLGAVLTLVGVRPRELLLVQRGRPGQVVDAAMVDGAAALLTSMFGLFGAGAHLGERGTNLLDSGAPHYEVYRCADGEYVSIADEGGRLLAYKVTEVVSV